MGDYTPNLNLYKPSVGETGWGEEVSANFDTLDAVTPSVVIAGVFDFSPDIAFDEDQYIDLHLGERLAAFTSYIATTPTAFSTTHLALPTAGIYQVYVAGFFSVTAQHYYFVDVSPDAVSYYPEYFSPGGDNNSSFTSNIAVASARGVDVGVFLPAAGNLQALELYVTRLQAL